MTTPTLETGRKYLFRYMIPGVHRKPRWGLAMYLDAKKLPLDVELTMSGRPEFGTTTVMMSHIDYIEQMNSSIPCFMDRTTLPRSIGVRP
jgi:hypothetical protein